MTPSISVQASIVPTGGAILLSISSEGSACFNGMTVGRNVNGGSFTQIYSGAGTSLFLDVGDGTDSALNPTQTYTYLIQDAVTPAVSAETIGITPACELTLIQDITTENIRRMMQSGLNSLVVPNTYKVPQFLAQMPLTSTPALPFVTMNLDTVEQEEIPIGFGIPLENFTAESLSPSGATAVWTVQGLQNRRYSFHLLCKTYQERDYFESAIMGLIYGMQSMLTKANLNVRFSYMASQGAVEGDEANPGFYYSQIMMGLTSVSMTQISALMGTLTNIYISANSGATSATLSGSGLVVST